MENLSSAWRQENGKSYEIKLFKLLHWQFQWHSYQTHFPGDTWSKKKKQRQNKLRSYTKSLLLFRQYCHCHPKGAEFMMVFCTPSSQLFLWCFDVLLALLASLRDGRVIEILWRYLTTSNGTPFINSVCLQADRLCLCFCYVDSFFFSFRHFMKLTRLDNSAGIASA